jgi:hypothetical protein
MISPDSFNIIRLLYMNFKSSIYNKQGFHKAHTHNFLFCYMDIFDVIK